MTNVMGEIIVRIDKPSNPGERGGDGEYLTVPEWKSKVSGKVSKHALIKHALGKESRRTSRGERVRKRSATVATEKNSVDQAQTFGLSVQRDCSLSLSLSLLLNPVQRIWIIDKKSMVMRLVKDCNHLSTRFLFIFTHKVKFSVENWKYRHV